MSLLSAIGLDRPRAGSHYTDRMRRILGACSACGLVTIDKASGTHRALVQAAPHVDIDAPEHGYIERYPLSVHPSALSRVLGMARQFASALNVASVDVQQDGGIVWVSVHLPMPAVLSFTDAWQLAPDIPRGHLLLGVRDNGAQLTLDMAANYHVAVIGQTRSGKSTLMQTMILSAQMSGAWQVALFDPTGDFTPLSGAPCIWQNGLFNKPDDIAACLQWLADKTRHNESVGHVLAFVDEGKILGQRQDIRASLATLTQAGSHSGVHVVLGAQDSTGFGAEIANNMRARMVGRMATAQYAGLAGAPGAERLTRPGQFIGYTAMADDVRFQAAMPSAAEIASLCPYAPRCGVVPVASVAEQFTPGANVAPGRTADDLPPHVRSQMVRYYVRHGKRPTRRAVSEWADIPGGLDNDKWHRWESEALGVHYER